MRQPAFDPARLEDELDELLPPLEPARAAQLRPDRAVAAAWRPSADSVAESSQYTAQPADRLPVVPRVARRAGRPPGVASAASGSVNTVVRVPKALYDAVVHDLLGASVERPSYAQVIAWTCEDHREEVLAELAHALRTEARAPRGRRLASDVVPLTIRFRPGERDALDEIVDMAFTDVGTVVTRTAAAVAALRVAVKQGLSSST